MGHYLYCLIGRSPNEPLFKTCSHLRSMQLTKESKMNSKTSLLNVANDDKIFSSSRFSERPWAPREQLFSAYSSTTSFISKTQKGVIYGKEDENYIASYKSKSASSSCHSQLSSFFNFLPNCNSLERISKSLSTHLSYKQNAQNCISLALIKPSNTDPNVPLPL